MKSDPIHSAILTCKSSSVSVSSLIAFYSSSSTSSSLAKFSFSVFLLSESNNNLNTFSDNSVTS